jgi:hypothetical protein
MRERALRRSALPELDDVELKLENCLVGGGTIVGAKVEGVRCRGGVRVQMLLGPVDPDEEAGFFGAAGTSDH